MRDKRNIAGFEDGEGIQELRKADSLSKRRKEMNSPLEFPERNAALPAPKFLPSETWFDVWPPAMRGNKFVLFLSREIWGNLLQPQ